VPKGLLEIAVGGDLEMTESRIVTYNGAAIKIHGLAGPDSPVGGSVDIGTNELPGISPFGTYLGVMTLRGGGIDITATGDVNVDQSRVATFGGGDIHIASTQGNVNAGTGGADQSVKFVFADQTTDSQGHITTIYLIYNVPGSGIFTFAPQDPSPLPMLRPPFTGFPELQAVFFSLIQQAFLGHNTEILAAEYDDLRNQAKTVFDSYLLGNIDLKALNGAVVVPPGGIRGKTVTIEAKILDLQGGTLSGDVAIDVGQIIGDPAAVNGGQFAGSVGGEIVLPTSGSSLGGLSGSTGSLSTATASTTASVASSAQDAVAEEAMADDAAQDKGVEKSSAGGKEADDLKGKRNRNRKVVQSLNFKKGVTIEVNVSDN